MRREIKNYLKQKGKKEGAQRIKCRKITKNRLVTH